MAENDRWNSCINRLYYSSFYLISALLYQNNIKAESHAGVKNQFYLDYIKSSIIDEKYGKLFSHLFDWRQESDYADFIEFDENTVIPLLTQVKELNNLIKNQITEK